MKTMYAGVVIVGAGLAGVSVAESLRNSGFTGPVALVSEEPHAPYDRPPLSKQFMLNGDADSVGIGTDVLKQVDFHQGERIDRVDAVNKRVVFASGKELAWNKLVLATGALPHRLVPLEAGPLLTTSDGGIGPVGGSELALWSDYMKGWFSHTWGGQTA